MEKLDRKRALKLRFRRHLHLQRRQVGEFSAQAEQRIENDVFKRLERLGNVRRFVISWFLLLALLIGVVIAQTRSLGQYYQQLVPASGGTYTEGILGSFTNANPIYATDTVDASVSKLIFAGLLTYDQNNHLVGDLADKWSVNDEGTVYTVHLRPNLTWQDGQPLTAEDVVFTYQVIENADARSPLYNSWQGIRVVQVDKQTVSFTLPNRLASFPYSLTNGLVPKHLLVKVPMADMRTTAFNSNHPIGSGPFQWQAIELKGQASSASEERIALKPFVGYQAGKPKLSNFVVRAFSDKSQLISAFKKQQVNAIVGLTEIPPELQNDKSLQAYNFPLTAAVMTFFRNSQPVLSDPRVRFALVSAADVPDILSGLKYATVQVREPLLQGQLGYNPAIKQAGHNIAYANKLLDEQGWVMKSDGIRYKDGVPLAFQLSALDSGEYPSVANQLARQWRAVGADVKVVLSPDQATFQNILAYHNYDAVLYGISIGVDPDVYVYWDSTQADVRAPVRLNLSEYTSKTADASLEAGRTRLDPALRAEKYKPFLQAWQADSPALGLYQPRFLYITHGPVYGLTEHPINSDVERFTNVQNWAVRQARKTIN
ncbi:MAG TPA: peptide ABC transporter substrate-binding protein [Patescibacteria group bacterium]|nr:peptide ABC transporter substrate-binding protein [Patescibacteria group bacterium]